MPTDARTAHPIDRGWWTECSACGGNADPHEDAHIHGGPDPGGSQGPRDMRSALSATNGCGARFVQPEASTGGQA